MTYGAIDSIQIRPEVMSDLPKQILITRNGSLTMMQAGLIVGFLAMVLALIGIWFQSRGAWLVLPFAGIELLAVATGFYVSVRHNNDYELVEIDHANIRVRRSIANCEQNFSFQTYWTKVRLEMTAGWHPSRLWMKSKGRQVELGSWLTDPERKHLADRLKRFIEQDWNKVGQYV